VRAISSTLNGCFLQATLGRLDQWLGARFRAEVASAKALWSYIADVVEQEKELQYRLELLSEDFIVDEVRSRT
jgi:hypothetical protein